MRYNVHSPCAFHSRIAKTLGVLVGAALVATLGLPSAAQAQTIKTVTYADGPGFTVTWLAGRLDTGSIDNWIVTFTNPDGVKVTKTTSSVTPVMLDENDLGTWWIQVDACFEDFEGDNTPPDECPDGELEESPSVGYTHGTFPAPGNLDASLIPDGVYLSWTVGTVEDDFGFVELSILDGWRGVGKGRGRVTGRGRRAMVIRRSGCVLKDNQTTT